MAIIRGVRKLLKSDFPDAPQWFDNLLRPLNEFMDSVIGGLRNKLTFRENFYSDIKEYTFTHNIELNISFNLDSYQGLLITKTPEDQFIVGWKARVISTGVLGVTILFSGGAASTGNCKIVILG